MRNNKKELFINVVDLSLSIVKMFGSILLLGGAVKYLFS